MSGLDRTGALVLGFLLLVALAASPAGAQVALDTYKEHETRLPPGAAATVLAEVPFHLDQDGSVYAKLLPTPWNAVNDGIPNGTVNANHTEGLTGWHIRYVLTDENGVPLTVDGKGNPVSADLGVYADATPTKPVFLKAGTPYRFLGIITVPEEAARPGVTSKVVFALVFREGEFLGDGTSGGRLEQSRAFTEIIRFEGDLVVTDPPTPVEDNRTPTTNGSAPSTGLPGTPSTVTAPGASQGGHTIIYVPSQPELAWLIPLAAGVAVLSLLVAALSLALCLYLMVVLRRERLQ